MNKTNVFEQAVTKSGGITALAKSLGLSQSRVSNWRSRGVPAGWLEVIRLSHMAKAKKPVAKKVVR